MAVAAALPVRAVAHGAVDSTMDLAAEDRGPWPAVHLANRQRRGRGRSGRGWASPPGNLYATIVWPDPEGGWPPAALAAIQLAWAEAIVERGGPDARCKWPNDGVVGEGKWSGLLARSLAGPGGRRLLVGLGANLATAPDDLPDASLPPTALAAHWPGWPGPEAIARLLVEAAIDVLRAGSAAALAGLGRWPERDALAPGETLVVDTSTGTLEGEYAGIDGDGRLRLRTAGGEARVTVAEAVRVRRDQPVG